MLLCAALQHSASTPFALPLHGSGCCGRQFCLYSRTRPLLLWKCWSSCLTTLSPCKRMWLSGFACCSWSCTLPAAAMHRLQVRSCQCIAHLMHSKDLRFCVCNICNTRIFACNQPSSSVRSLPKEDFSPGAPQDCTYPILRHNLLSSE